MARYTIEFKKKVVEHFKKYGAVLLIFTIFLEFVIFMIVDGEVIENLMFLLFAIPPGVVLKISTYQEEKREENNYN